MKQIHSKKGGSSSNGGGFTLIEVVLVLAIGGLIFLLAFLAFGQATQNRRDTQRRSDAARVITELENASGDSNGKPLGSSPAQGDLDSFVANYLKGSGTSPSKFTSNNITYSVYYGATLPTGTVTSSTAILTVKQSAKCDGNTITSTSNSVNGDFAVAARLEKGVACRDNQ